MKSSECSTEEKKSTGREEHLVGSAFSDRGSRKPAELNWTARCFRTIIQISPAEMKDPLELWFLPGGDPPPPQKSPRKKLCFLALAKYQPKKEKKKNLCPLKPQPPSPPSTPSHFCFVQSQKNGAKTIMTRLAAARLSLR